jgi:uncharacterized FlaG/YvyC family protein
MNIQPTGASLPPRQSDGQPAQTREIRTDRRAAKTSTRRPRAVAGAETCRRRHASSSKRQPRACASFVQPINNNMEFSVNEDTGQLVVKIIDRHQGSDSPDAFGRDARHRQGRSTASRGLFVKQIGLNTRSGALAGLHGCRRNHGDFITGPGLESRCKQHRQPVDGGRAATADRTGKKEAGFRPRSRRSDRCRAPFRRCRRRPATSSRRPARRRCRNSRSSGRRSATRRSLRPARQSSAVAGTYLLEVTRLASQHVIASATGAASPFSGAGTTLPTGGTLTHIARQRAAAAARTRARRSRSPTAPRRRMSVMPSTAASAGVSAVVINGTAGKQLVLTSDAAGSNQFITLAGNPSLAYDPNATPVPATDPFAQTQAAQGSAFKLNGIAVEASSNTVTTAIDGVTLNLLKGPELPATSVSTTLTISRDTSQPEQWRQRARQGLQRVPHDRQQPRQLRRGKQAGWRAQR